jgi:hypothetical protein
MPVWRMIKGYLAACAAAAVTIAILAAAAILIGGQDSPALAVMVAFVGTPMAFVVIIPSALPGALLLMVIARGLAITSRTFYAIGGALNALLVMGWIEVRSEGSGSIFFDFKSGSTFFDFNRLALVLAAVAGGYVAGRIYWSTAVRTFKMESGVLPKPKDWGPA